MWVAWKTWSGLLWRLPDMHCWIQAHSPMAENNCLWSCTMLDTTNSLTCSGHADTCTSTTARKRWKSWPWSLTVDSSQLWFYSLKCLVPECLASVSDVWTLFSTNGSGKIHGAISSTRNKEVAAYYSQNIVSAFWSSRDVWCRNSVKSGCYSRLWHWVWNVHIVSFTDEGIAQVWSLLILLTWPEPEEEWRSNQ